jgi:saccharopine dehydrogenase-like NADP-dependent oxidoreductase
MKVIIFGATGMVGKGVLLECLDDTRVENVVLVSRHPVDVSNTKVSDPPSGLLRLLRSNRIADRDTLSARRHPSA